MFYFNAQIIGIFEGIQAFEGDRIVIFQEFLREMKKNEPPYIVDFFEELAYTLHTILKEYDSWEDSSFLTPINKLINDFWLKCGFKSDDRLFFELIE